MRDDKMVCSTMDSSLTLNSTEAEFAGITKFSNEACEATEVLDGFNKSTIAFPQPKLQDIKQYFERPRLVNRGTLPYGSQTRIWDLSVSTSSISALFPQWANRLSGAYGIRYSLNVRVQVAATPFHAGVYTLCNQYGGATGPTNFDRTLQFYTATNLPHVRLDLSESTAVELKVPFLYRNEFSLVDVNDTGVWTKVALTPFYPVVTVSGLNTPTYEIFVYLTDIELFGADNNNPTTVTLQSGLSEFGKELKKAGVISSALGSVAKISKIAGKSIPSLAALAGPVEWVAGTAAGIAKYFGYSKPLIQGPIHFVHNTRYAQETNVDVPATAMSASLFQTNSLVITPEVGGTDIDEMALDYILKQWSPCCMGAVGAANTHGTVVYAAPVSPACMYFRTTILAPFCNRLFPKDSGATGGSVTNSIMPTSLMNISSLFRLWRGDIKFRITFAKTKFHAGRYMFSFNPGVNFKVDAFTGINTVDGPEIVSGLVQPYGYSEIIDLKDSNVFEFTCPYMVELPYLTFCSSSGSLTLTCIDPLIAPASVSSSVGFIIEVCAGDNYELADYGGPWFAPFPAGTINIQSGELVSVAKKSPADIIVGERVLSVKQIIMSPSWVKFTRPVGVSKELVYPWYVSPPVGQLNAIKATPMPATMTFSGNTAASFIAKSYAFARGGTDYHIYPAGSPLVKVIYDQSSSDSYFTYMNGNLNQSGRLSNSSTPKIVAYGDIPVHIRAPAFQTRIRVPTQILDDKNIPAVGAASDFTGFDARSHVDRVTTVNDGTTTATWWLAKSASDDATLTHYMGPVPLVVPNAASTVRADQDWYV